MGGLVLKYKSISFLQVFSLFFCWYHSKHIFDNKNLGIANWPIEGKKTICFFQTVTKYKNVDIMLIPTHEHPLGVSHGNLNMAMVP